MYRWYGEEIECGDHLAMIPQKGEPPWIGVTTANHAAQISGPGPFRDGKAELLQFRVDFGGAPVGILLRQASDPIPDFLRDPRPPAAGTPPPAPIEPKAGTMPANDGIWFDNEKDIGPAGPHAAEGGPK